MGFIFAPVSCATWLFSSSRTRQLTPEENFSKNFQENLKFWEEENNKINNAFVKLGYKIIVNNQHIPVSHNDRHIAFSAFINDDYFIETHLTDNKLEMKIFSNHYSYYHHDKEQCFMQSCYISMTYFEIEDYYNMTLNMLNSSIEEYKAKSKTDIIYNSNNFEKYYGKNKNTRDTFVY